MTTKKTLFLTLEEYKEDINNLFLKFTFGDPDFIDLNVMEQIFIALEKPLSQITLKKLQDEMKKDNLNGIPYQRFEALYLQSFPYNSSNLLNEAFDIFDQSHKGKITLEDMKAIAKKLSLKFTDDELQDMIHTFDNTDTAITYEIIKNSYE